VTNTELKKRRTAVEKATKDLEKLVAMAIDYGYDLASQSGAKLTSRNKIYRLRDKFEQTLLKLYTAVPKGK
jgi:SAM-dependent MidA family methyltransferase